MTNDSQENFTERDEFVNEEDTQITIPPAPNFDAAQPTPVQPVIPIAHAPGEVLGAYPQQPQVVYVAQPTAVPSRSWGWIPAALVLLLAATIAGAFVGAELYKRSTYAEAMPYSPEDVSPAAKQEINENKSVKTAEQNAFTSKEVTSSDAPKSSETTSSSIGFAQKGKIESHNSKNSEPSGESDSEENSDEAEAQSDENSENNDSENADNEEDKPKKDEKKTINPAELKEQIKKVENKKDTENIVPPQRSLPNDF